MDQTTSQTIARMLLQIKAVKLQAKNPFTWASGWKSPIYCDNRKTLSYPTERNYIKWAFCKLITEQYPQAECIAGVATGAISWGSLVADALGLPFVYIRSAAKDHGMQNLIEGDLKKNSKVVVIEDLISTGGSSIKAVEAIKEAGADVLSLIAVYTHGFKQAEDLFSKINIPMTTLSHYDDVIAMAVSSGYITASEVKMLQEWRKNPSEWNPTV
ncbi:MAG: orotate phosphoribosyltransferase [Porphyromonas sp.]|nr:orotate phosphoribosyltransferase [Porphyromonas sp.]